MRSSLPPASLLISVGALLFTSPACAQSRDAEDIYAQFCASCHGANLAGGSAPSMLDDEWVHGGTDADIARVITEGALDQGMPAWGPALTDAEIRALVVYLRERRAGYVRRPDSLPMPDSEHVFNTSAQRYRIETVIDDIDTPWSLNWLPDGTMLVTEKSGTLRLFRDGELSPAIMDTPWVDSSGQAGLLEVAPHPDYARNGWIYLTFSDPQVNAAGDNVSFTKVVRGRISDGTWTDEEVIFAADVELYRRPGGPHYGSRIAFDDHGYIYFSIGDRGSSEHAQDLGRPNGKIHRLHDDGRVPADNPFVHEPGAIASIWSYGHRNPQGLDIDPQDGRLWDTEHGPRGGDELNIIEKGHNYGWPVITYGMNYNGTPITAETARDGMDQPVTHWTPSIAVCGIDFYEGNAFPAWKGNLLVTALAQQHVRRVVIEAGQVVEQEVIFEGFGRCRDVASGPDGTIYIALNGPNRVVRLVPVE
ncbi:PQQ-dependent sugar dehydrogenase [Synoicihabitans lomoniglobus]|uniref:PQQ-dependent sugar dehydrogenase n=1 Tax=Synoicihabitans lomoniglobus TaxID=2909285 RepID=A0AAF0CQT7_9BACT|nr:PQQ-dependent sugar dehydrogenase [Opitutaceae bacterium LMO-M01]WED66384.1 PQQ-dependent sugar dehydrogenase [Opitutaceae bacterium LMO-M01]